jgi:hypothetical protein
MISPDLLAAKKELLIKQRDNALAIYQQAVGALALIENLEPYAGDQKQAMTLEEFAQSVGAESAEIVSNTGP